MKTCVGGDDRIMQLLYSYLMMMMMECWEMVDGWWNLPLHIVPYLLQKKNRHRGACILHPAYSMIRWGVVVVIVCLSGSQWRWGGDG